MFTLKISIASLFLYQKIFELTFSKTFFYCTTSNLTNFRISSHFCVGGDAGERESLVEKTLYENSSYF